MSLWNVITLLVLVTEVCSQFQIPTRIEDVQPIFRTLPKTFSNFSFTPENFGELSDLGDSLCLAKLKKLSQGLQTFNQESIACKYTV